MEEVSYIAKPLKLIRLNDEAIPGCGVIDITFQNASGIEISKLSFRNNYTSFITIKGSSLTGEPKTLLKNYCLMKHCHYADESQNHIIINNQDLSNNNSLNGLRFILRQPSPQWKCFGIEDIKVYTRIPKIKNEFSEIKEDITKIESIFNMMQCLRLSSEPIHFDIDGDYKDLR